MDGCGGVSFLTEDMKTTLPQCYTNLVCQLPVVFSPFQSVPIRPRVPAAAEDAAPTGWEGTAPAAAR